MALHWLHLLNDIHYVKVMHPFFLLTCWQNKLDARYEYLDPSYKDNESDIADTPGLERAETPMSYDSPIRHSPKKSIAPSMMHSSPQRSTLDSPQRSMLNSPQRSMLHSPQRSMLHSHQRSMIHSPRRSMIDTSLMNHRLAEERKRMDMLQSKVTKIRRHVSLMTVDTTHVDLFLLVVIFSWRTIFYSRKRWFYANYWIE